MDVATLQSVRFFFRAARTSSIRAALSGEETRIRCDGLSKDILATVACLRAMGAEIREEGSDLCVRPIRDVPTAEVPLPCGESGSTLRFLLPVEGALGIRGRFLREGRLPERPLAPLDRELTDHGMELWTEGSALAVQGKLLPKMKLHRSGGKKWYCFPDASGQNITILNDFIFHS